MSGTNASELNHVKIFNNIVRDSFLHIIIHSFLRVMIHTSAGQKFDGKRMILKYEPIRVQTIFHMTNIPPMLRLEHGVFLPET